MSQSDVVIVIPAYNEEKTIAKVVSKAKKFGDVLVVNDGSKDKTSEYAKKAGAIVISSPVNMGKGFALKVAQEWLKTKEYRKVVLIDADLQHNPEEIPKLINALKGYDAVLSYRKFGADTPLIKKLGNFLINTLFFILFGKKIKDTQCGFRAFKKDVFTSLSWESNDYFVDTEIVIDLIQKDYSFVEVETTTSYHEPYKGTTVLDGIKIGLKMLKKRLGG